MKTVCNLDLRVHSEYLLAQDNALKSWEPTTKWEAKLKEITWASGDDHPRFRHEKWRQVFEKQVESTPLTIQAADPLFSLPLGEESVKFTYWLSREAILNRYHSQSQFAVLEGEQLLVSHRQMFSLYLIDQLILWLGH